MSHKRPVFIAMLVLTAVMTAAHFASAGSRPAPRQDEVPHLEAPPGDGMLDAWRSFVQHLEPEQAQRIGFAFDAEERRDWAYVPRDRVGLAIGGASEDAMRDARRLLRSGLGAAGTDKAFEIIGLEEVLFAQSNGRAMRDPGRYFFAVFGVPTTEGAWGWRFEGHHLSVNFTMLNHRVVSSTPAFFGGNPAQVPDDAEVNPGLQPFAQEQGLGWALVRSFEGAQAETVIIARTAPDDILTTNAARAEMGAPEGVAYGDMKAEQQATFMELLGVYAARMNAALAEYQMAKIRRAGLDRVHFAWAGGTGSGEPHYYRIHGPTFIIEWDNTQGGANHVHSVWRDFADDFGYDPLRRHLAAAHGIDVPDMTTIAGTPLGIGNKIEDDERAHQGVHEQGTPHSHSR